MYAQCILLVFKEEIKTLTNTVYSITLCEKGLLNFHTSNIRDLIFKGC